MDTFTDERLSKSSVAGETARIAKLDREGNLIDNFTCEGKDCDYYIKDMAEYEGRVYLSAYAGPSRRKLAVNGAGELAWDVESVVSTFFSPATSSFTIGGTCQVFRYTIDAAGILLQQKDTGETVPYHR